MRGKIDMYRLYQISTSPVEMRFVIEVCHRQHQKENQNGLDAKLHDPCKLRWKQGVKDGSKRRKRE